MVPPKSADPNSSAANSFFFMINPLFGFDRRSIAQGVCSLCVQKRENID
jgi:hypothetical protein